MPPATLAITLRPQATLTVAPQLVAQSALLQLSFLALESRIERELEDNPALELEETAQFRTLAWLSGGSTGRGAEPPPGVEETLRAPYTLQDDLWWQFRAAAAPRLHPVGQRLIADVDEAGYLRADLFEVAGELGASVEEVQEAIGRLQGLEPAGVGARTLAECLLLQIARWRAEGWPVPDGAEAVVRACVGAVRADLVGQLAHATGRRRAEVEQVLAYVRGCLCPYPGLGRFAPEQASAAPPGIRYPDVILRRQGREFTVEIPLSRSRFLRLNQAYLELERAHRERGLRQGTPGERQAEEQLAQAREFLRLLQRREQILKRITAALLSRQRDFLLHGPMFHHELSKKEIAALTGLHEATVCRATRGKYVLLPSGAVESFDLFFASAIPVKRVLADLVHRETPQRPLSDQQIARLLAQRGYHLARRTVTKYRQVLRIASSAERRQRAA